ncbi:MAG TPA: FAD-binding oxidoreductase [Deltaproteobacteria bacterium]|nr:FAD-binding oxidoreductase [SAR324 cluster bacterium]HCB32895.1 FAD-binding oxidoreductase [Deltaproteobacteria bacterium]
MSRLPKTASVVILGGGVMGASTVYHLASRGYKDVLLLEREKFFGTGATGRCAGGIRYQFNTEVNIRLSQKSLPMIDAFEEETGQSVLVQKCGYLFALTREKDVEVFRKTVELQRSLGVQTEWLTGDEVRSIAAPCDFPDALAGSFNAEDGLADPNSIVMGYINAARRHGAVCITDCSAIGIDVKNNQIRKVQTSLGTIETKTVVNACGPWSASLGKEISLEISVFPLRRQWFVTEAIQELPEDFPFVIDFAQSLYFHREGSGLLTGMSNPNEKIGDDQRIDSEWELKHIESAIRRMPLLGNSGIQARQAGLYEMTPDAHPIIGPTPVEGFYLLSGFSGHGFMQGPICGKLMAEILIDGEATTVDISKLDYNRFAEKRLIPEYNVV